ncbi:MAG: hypothetical protein JWM07_307, partial [Candidatus Saccharibacteria bacterium]|nr:hypothetical protein [Candidatus Saccharibacteria bacterium]
GDGINLYVGEDGVSGNVGGITLDVSSDKSDVAVDSSTGSVKVSVCENGKMNVTTNKGTIVVPCGVVGADISALIKKSCEEWSVGNLPHPEIAEKEKAKVCDELTR